MNSMFQSARSFNKRLGDWRVDKVTSMNRMFSNAKRFNRDLGWCVYEVNTHAAFSGTMCESEKCGVKKKKHFGTCDEGLQALFIILSFLACCCFMVLPNVLYVILACCCKAMRRAFCWFWWVSKKDNKREVLREAYKENNCIQRLLIILILLPFLPFISCIYLFWWLFTKAGESCKVVPAAVDAAPVTSEESSAPATSEEQAVPMGTVEAVHEGEEQVVPMGTVEAVHEGESPVPYATVLSVEQ